MQKLLSASIIAIAFALPALADNEPTTPTLIPASEPGCNQAVLNTTEGSASLEAIYTPNTIGTTWYSDGVRLTVDNAATSCTYDTAMTLPTNPTKAGYEFTGWKIRCLIPSADANNNAESYGCLDMNGNGACVSNRLDQNASNYGITERGKWGVTWSNGDKVTGVALCSQTSSRFFAATGTPDETGSGNARYCWCKATHYTASGGSQCALPSPAWAFSYDLGATGDCVRNCAVFCPYYVQSRSDFRPGIFTGLVAQ